MANFLKRNGLTDEGDLRLNGNKGEWVKPTIQWNDVNGWIVWGMARQARFDVSDAAADFLEKYQDPRTGGFLTGADPDRNYDPVPGFIDIGSTCTGVMAMIYTGRWAEAIKGCDFFIHALENQPKPKEAFYCRFATDGTAETGFPEETTYFNVVKIREPRQAYGYFGFAARMLALVYRATGEKKYLDAALRYIDVFEQCNEDRYDHWANDKVAWASSLLYQITGDRAHAERGCRCFDPIVEKQRDDGVWHWTFFFDTFDKQPRGITTELALEFAFLLYEMIVEMESAEKT
jgi:hypothetical protein